MSKVGSISSGMMTGIRGYGGLVSGLDRDSLIQNMTFGTRSKIQQQMKKKTLFQWRQEAYRSISSKLIEFSRKYTSYYNPSTNLSSVGMFARTLITPQGANSKYVTVAGSSATANSVSVLGVSQLAVDAKMASLKSQSKQSMESGLIDSAQVQTLSNIEGQSITFKHGGRSYNVSFGSGKYDDGTSYDYKTASGAAQAMNEAFQKVDITGGKNLSDVLEAKVESVTDSSGNTTDQVYFVSKDTAGNTLQVANGSGDVLKSLGLMVDGENFSELGDDRKTITSTGLKPTSPQTLTRELTFADMLGGKSLTFDYNGTAKTITLLDKDKITNLRDVQQDLQAKLNKEFGNGRIQVGIDGTDTAGKLTFKTTNPVNQADDDSSTLAVTYGDLGVLGKDGALKLEYGASNRLNLSAKLLDSGLARADGVSMTPEEAAAKELRLKINGQEIKGLTYASSIGDIMRAINDSDAGVKISYQKVSDKFIMESTFGGAGGSVDIEEGGPGETLPFKIFGDAGTDYKVEKGQDAQITVKYSGSDSPVTLIRGSNTFNVDGLSITVKDTFGFDGNGALDGSEPVTFDAKVDSDKIVKAITDMVKDYNDMQELVTKSVSTKPDREFYPLTDEEKEGLSESQLKTWEEKAKEGLLFNDSDLRSLSDKMKFLLGSGSQDRKKLSDMGITIGNGYQDYGKMVFNEEKFKAALAERPEEVQDMFTRKASTTTNSAGDKVTDPGGLMTRIKALTDQYASTEGAVKGILVEKAGSPYAPTSMIQNALQSQIKDIDSVTDRLQATLKQETDRYIKQFTTLETLISQMNAQSSWLNQQFGGQAQ